MLTTIPIRKPAAEAAGRAIGEALNQPWSGLHISEQSELALAGEAAAKASAPFVEFEVLQRLVKQLPGNGARDREIRAWLDQQAQAAARRAFTR